MADKNTIWAHSPASDELPEDVIFVDTLRCTGCWTCALACMTGNGLKDGQFFVTVRTLGSGEGIDRPAGTWPDLHMSWQPVWTAKCVKCAGRLAKGQKPYCVQSCPCGALSIGDAAAAKKEELRERGFRFFEMPPWESTRDGVVYAEKK